MYIARERMGLFKHYLSSLSADTKWHLQQDAHSQTDPPTHRTKPGDGFIVIIIVSPGHLGRYCLQLVPHEQRGAIGETRVVFILNAELVE